MSADLVRVCPACGARHPPERMRCSCGALLFGVDLVQPVSPDTDAEAPASTPAAAPQTPPAVVRCPHDDCGQPNPPGSHVCLYCNRALTVADASADAEPAPTALLQLPSALRARYRVLRAFEARGAEADILLAEPIERDSQAPAALVVKIYRQGIRPGAEVQARIAQVDPRHRVTVVEAGLSDSRAYEVMEYCVHGSLRQRMTGQALAPPFIVEVIRELAPALQAVHAAALVHRDLKPENVLLRAERPLDLVLTDFSTASVIDATQRFTSMARTLLYAAPEALSGVIDAKADYWALGMTLLEMATGAHPFRGLSEAVILYHLSTRAIDLVGVADTRLRKLLAGLLLRDPKQRWGASEVSRWLAGDDSLPDAVEQGAESGFVQPYAVLHERCTTPEQLAVAFARHWQAGLADLANGQLLRWFTEVRKDQNAIRLLLELRYDSHLNPDQQLLRFILHYAPGIPPMWQGHGIELPALLTQANRALQGDPAAAEELYQLHQQRVLDTYAAAGNAQAAELSQRWNAAANDFEAAWQDLLVRLQSHGAPVPDPGQETVHFDDVVHGQGVGAQPVRPPPAALHPRFLAIAYDPAWVERLRARLERELDALAAQGPWLAELGDPRAMTPAQLLACETLLPEARKTVEHQARRQALRQQQQVETEAELHAALRANLAQIGLLAQRVTFLFQNTEALRQTLDEHASLMAHIRAHATTDDAWLAVRRQALRGEPAALRLRQLCDHLGERAAANAGWFSQQAAVFGMVALVASSILLRPRGPLLVLAMAALIAAWRVLPMLLMAQDIRRLGQGLQRSGARL